MTQRFLIAGLRVDMELTYERTARQGVPYRLENDTKPADITLSLNDTVMERARKTYNHLSDDDLEYLLLGFLFYDYLLDFDGMMLHASAVAAGQYAYLFSADSGVGKSTMTGHWLEYLGDKAFIINDDKPAIRRINGVYYVFGTPFSGKHDISRPVGVQLGGICFIERAAQNWIRPAEAKEILPMVWRNTASRRGKERIEKRLDFLDALLTEAPLYRMGCINDISAAEMSFNAMKRTVPVYLDEIIDLVKQQIKDGGSVKFRTRGSSMMPLLVSDRDSVILAKPLHLKRGDVILFEKPQGGYVLHRIRCVDGQTLITRGDANNQDDAPISADCVIGVATAFERNGKTFSCHHPLYSAYRLFHRTFVERFARALYHRLKPRKKKEL